MTPAQFLSIFKQFNFKLKHALSVLPNTPAETVQQWADGSKIIPADVADRLRRLSVAHETLKLQAMEEAESTGKTIFWPSYLYAADFKSIDPLEYEAFLGCPRVYSQALTAAESAFLSMIWRGSNTKGNVRTYCLTARAYFPWLDHHGLTNTKANRRHFAEQSHELHRPPTDEEFKAKMQQLIDAPLTSSEERRHANNMLRLQLIAEAKNQDVGRQREGLKPQIPTPKKVVEDFFASRASV